MCLTDGYIQEVETVCESIDVEMWRWERPRAAEIQRLTGVSTMATQEVHKLLAKKVSYIFIGERRAVHQAMKEVRHRHPSAVVADARRK